MAITLNATISGTAHDGTNSYVTAAFADDYFVSHWSPAKATLWQNLLPNQKERLLIAATNVLETIRFTYKFVRLDARFRGYYNKTTMKVIDFQQLREPVPFYYYQVLQFPRNLDIDVSTGLTYIPPRVQIAQCEQAVYMANFDETALATRMQGISEDDISIGRSQISMRQKYGAEGTMMSPFAWEQVKSLVVRGQKVRRG